MLIAPNGRPLPPGVYLDPYDDLDNRGLEFRAKAIMELTTRNMGASAVKAFSLAHVDPDWRAFCRRRFATNRATYEYAKAALTAHMETRNAS